MGDVTKARGGASASSWTVENDRIVDCPFSFALDEADELFALLEASGATVSLRKAGLPVPIRLSRRVSVHFARRRDATEHGRAHDEIAFGWTAPAFWLPNLEGVIRFRSETLRTRVFLHGTYTPPFGALGIAFDRLAGRRLAAATLDDLSERLALMLETRFRAFRERNEMAG